MGDPTYMYKVVGGEVKAEVFDSESIPKGWSDSPESAQAKKVRKPKNDNSINPDK